jgi:hypothetical protein
MQSGLTKEEFWPTFFYLLKGFGHLCLIRSMDNGNEWLYKKSIFKKRNTITNTMSVE